MVRALAWFAWPASRLTSVSVRSVAGGGHFVLYRGGEHGSDGDSGAGLLRDEADDLGESVGDGLAVESERLGELAVLGLQPGVEAGRQRLGINAAGQRVEHVGARRGTEFLARGPIVAEGLALAGVELLGQAHEVGGALAAHEDRQGGDGEDGSEPVVGVARARVGHAAEGGKQRLGLREFDGQHAHRGERLRGAALRRQRREGAAQQDGGRGPERFEPDAFQAGAGLVVIAAGAAVARGAAGLLPAGSPVTGALEALRIDEGLGEQRRVAVCLLPPLRQVPDRFAEHAAGEVGLGLQQAEARLLHGQFQALSARARVPADPRLSGLESLGRGTPEQHRHPPAVALGNLPAAAPGHLRHRQVMMRREFLLAARGFVGSRGAKLHPREVQIGKGGGHATMHPAPHRGFGQHIMLSLSDNTLSAFSGSPCRQTGATKPLTLRRAFESLAGSNPFYDHGQYQIRNESRPQGRSSHHPQSRHQDHDQDLAQEIRCGRCRQRYGNRQGGRRQVCFGHG